MCKIITQGRNKLLLQKQFVDKNPPPNGRSLDWNGGGNRWRKSHQIDGKSGKLCMLRNEFPRAYIDKHQVRGGDYQEVCSFLGCQLHILQYFLLFFILYSSFLFLLFFCSYYLILLSFLFLYFFSFSFFFFFFAFPFISFYFHLMS